MTNYAKNGHGRVVRIERSKTANHLDLVRKFQLIDGQWVLFFRSIH